jgi:cytochrome bd ubiquinol oxidase subunit II
MTVVVILFLPLVLAYQAWTYYVFRRRVSARQFEPSGSPGAAAQSAATAPSVTAPAGGDGG